ncbi:MAG: TonB-dependent receptor [Chloroflexia bacterium]|nr:TonB-dependent receptor [Chloroflexia bacterium]
MLRKNKFYYNIEPRLSARYLINNRWSVKVAYSQMNQYIHLLTNSNIGLPTDLWLPVTDTIKPQNSVQYAAGTVISIGPHIDLSLEGYYKEMNNLIEYKEGATYLQVNEDWQKKVEIGKGNSYGAEILLRKKQGKQPVGLAIPYHGPTGNLITLALGKSFRQSMIEDMILALLFRISLANGLILVVAGFMVRDTPPL